MVICRLNGYLAPSTWSVHGLRVFDIVARDVANAAPGDMYFAHLLIPHAPYVYDRSCKLRDPDNWVDRPDPIPRLRRYELYLDQVECVYNRLQEEFDIGATGEYSIAPKSSFRGLRLASYLTEPIVKIEMS
jgi:hypothetical protein